MTACSLGQNEKSDYTHPLCSFTEQEIRFEYQLLDNWTAAKGLAQLAYSFVGVLALARKRILGHIGGFVWKVGTGRGPFFFPFQVFMLFGCRCSFQRLASCWQIQHNKYCNFQVIYFCFPIASNFPPSEFCQMFTKFLTCLNKMCVWVKIGYPPNWLHFCWRHPHHHSSM